MRTNEALIFSQLWLLIATRSTYKEKGLMMIPEINFISVSQKTSSSTSFPFHNFTGHILQQHEEQTEPFQRKRGFFYFYCNYYCENAIH